MTKSSVLMVRMSPELEATLAAHAEAAGVPVSTYLRGLAEQAVAVDDRDDELAARLMDGDGTAVPDLLALNVPSLVHRHCLGGDSTGTLIAALAVQGDDAKREELIAALLAGIDALQLAGPEFDTVTGYTETYGNRLARVRRAFA